MAVETSHQRLAGAIGKDKVSTSWLDRIAYSCDASLYQLVPRVVVRADNISDVQEIFRWSRREHIPITFRAAGTSLSGQAVTEHALVLVRRFDKFTIADGGQYVTAGSSLRGGYINARLRPYHCRIGPDPASIDACTVGGIVANNASGMCCGIAQNAYHTLAAMTMVLPSGLVLSTCDCAEADRMLLEHEPALYEQLSKLRDHVRCDTDLVRTIRHRTRLKNTMGYSIAAFLDFERPADILQHLLVGSEGTLGFIADVTLRTVPEPPHATAALIGFDSITAACSAVSAFDGEGAVVVELMDHATLAAIATYAPASTKVQLPRNAALLIEFRYDDPDTSRHVCATIERLSRLVCANQLTIASQEQQRKLLWTLRKGAMPSVGAARRTGTALINEDVAFPRERLADAVRDLQLLLAAHRFDDAVVFGHARDGNMHFAFSLDSDGSSIERYGQFMEQLAELVVERYDGSLKAEHSTGRNMAPFLEHQWGKRVVDLMRRVKQLLDPEGLLNPDVIFTQDRRIHLHNIKQLPPVSSHVDRCIECGFCERVCPSSELTLSPRQRIIVQREIVRHSRDCIARRLERDYVYAGMETCATDGLCMVTCPVGINSGDLTIAQRSQSKRMLERVYWQIAASRVRGWIRGIGIALSVARGASNVLGERLVHRTTERLARLFRIPSWLPAMGIPEHFSVTSLPEADVLYVPSCMACFGGRSPHGHSIVSSLLRIAERAGISVAVTRTAGTVCCGHPWHSYGYEHQYRHVLDQWVEAVFCESDGGRVPIVIDSSSCQLSLRVAREHSGKTGQMLAALRILGPVEFAELIVERLGIVGQSVSLIVHPACSLRRLDGGVESLVQVLQRSGCTVELPHSAWCCGMAGDRGLRYPELPAHALDVAIKEIAALDADMVVSTNLPCQWQLSHRIGKPVISLWEALDLLYQ